MSTTRETVLAALLARLQPLAALALRDEVLPKQIPAAGLITAAPDPAHRPASPAVPALSGPGPHLRQQADRRITRL